MSRYYADYVPPSSRERERSPPPRRPEYERSDYRERDRERERDYESSRRYERRSRSPDPRYERRPSPSYERRREREHYGYEDKRYERRETEHPAYDDRSSSRRYTESRRSPAPIYDCPREDTKKSEYEIEYDPKTRTFQGPAVKGGVPQPAYTSSKSLGIPKDPIPEPSDSSSKRKKSRKGPILNYFDPDILPNEKVVCPYNSAHIVQRKRLQGHLLYCRKKFPNPELKICPLNVLHVIKEDELESHILNCPDREIVKYLSFEPDFERESPPLQGLIESTENWDDDVVIDYDPNIQVEKFRKIAEAADKEGYIAPVEQPVDTIPNVTTSILQVTEQPVEQVEINGQVIKIKREKTENEEVNESETMALLDEQLKEPEPSAIQPKIVVVEPLRHYERMPVKKEWSPIPPRRRSPSPRRRKTPPPRRYSPSPPPRSISSRRRSPSPRLRTPPPRRRTPSPRRRSPSPRRRSPSPRRRSPSPRRLSPSLRRRSPGYYKLVSPPPRIKREPVDNNGYVHSKDRFDTSRRYERSPPPLYRVKDEFNGRGSSSRHDPYQRPHDEHSRKPKYDEYYARKPEYYEEKSKSTKDLYSKYEEYDRRPRYEERRRSPSPKAYPAAYRPRSRSPVSVRYERPRSRSPRPRPTYEKERYEKAPSPRYERRKTPPLAPPKSSKDYYEFPTYGSMIEKEKSFRKNPERRIKAEKAYSPPRSYKPKESRKSPEVADEDMIYTRQA